MQILSSEAAQALRMPETSTKTSAFCVASTRFSARAKPRPVSSRSVSTTRKMYWRGRGEAGADGRAAEVDHAQPLLAFVDAPAVAVQGLGIGAHLAAQGDEHGVLELGAAHLDHVGELLLLCLEGLLQAQHLLFELVQQADGRQPQGGGEGVVGRLVQVDVVERRDPLVVARAARRAARRARLASTSFTFMLVEVPAPPCSRSTTTCVAVQAVGELAAGPLDGVGLGRVAGPDAQVAVGQGGGELDRAVGTDELAVHRPPGEGEVVQGPHGVDAVAGRRPARATSPSRSASVRCVRAPVALAAVTLIEPGLSVDRLVVAAQAA